MKFIAKITFLFVILLSSFDASAVVAVRVSSDQAEGAKEISLVTPKNRKLKFKEKAALWIFRRKLKKQLKKQTKTIQRSLSDTTECDQIQLATGDILDVKLITVSDTDVRFVRCGVEGAEELTLSKSDVKKITLSEGVTIYQNTGAKKQNGNQAGKKYGVILGIGSVLLAVLSWPIIVYSFGLGFAFAVASVVLGVISWKQLAHTKNAVLGIIATILGGLSLGFFSFILVLLSSF